ncbi:ergothioneine biosynthesis protein EgtB [Granulicella sp. 5B5]|uniref:ergothioneine biosynthesis protein EgtB n=1 Tax=Granulicella sp. 5B5 TaxID=1617967 RepID=UPI0015F69CF5|nr:ergothioneine biosynthesis protein EgtB [Granulicella sp. 5B5]QMV19283.1 ergothioneine biosynthesis protein EgtB [Granulicella sp. 5B5]
MLTQQSTAAALLQRFRAVRAATMHFCTPLSPEDMMVQSCAEASPLKWHLAHTTWFFETFILADFVANYQPFNPDFRWLFNSYYKALGEMPEKKLRASFSRPPLDSILAYRTHVETAIERLLQHTPEDEILRRVSLGLEHEQQHLELAATDIKHAFYTNPLQPAYLPLVPGHTASHVIAPPVEWLGFSPGYPARPGVIEVGVTPNPKAVDSFAFDNETPRHSVYVAPFRLASRAVTVSEYLAFIDEGGYTHPEFWLSEGWDTVEREGWQAPLYWRRDSANPSGWSIFTLHGWRPLGELSETPVCHISLFEADAFARWSGHRLPTEFEWEFVAANVADTLGAPSSPTATGVPGEPPLARWGGSSSVKVGSQDANMLESAALHPRPAASGPGIHQLFGDVWEWTQSPYTGYPGYKPLPGALGEYNGKFMSSQMVLRGGSCVTPASHIRATYRNFFHPATRWQFSGLRLARDHAS